MTNTTGWSVNMWSWDKYHFAVETFSHLKFLPTHCDLCQPLLQTADNLCQKNEWLIQFLKKQLPQLLNILESDQAWVWKLERQWLSKSKHISPVFKHRDMVIMNGWKLRRTWRTRKYLSLGWHKNRWWHDWHDTIRFGWHDVWQHNDMKMPSHLSTSAGALSNMNKVSHLCQINLSMII